MLILKISVNWDKFRLIGTKFSQFRRKVLLIRENSNIFGEIHLYEDKNSVVLCKTRAKKWDRHVSKVSGLKSVGLV